VFLRIASYVIGPTLYWLYNAAFKLGIQYFQLVAKLKHQIFTNSYGFLSNLSTIHAVLDIVTHTYVACLHDQTKSGSFGGPAFFQAFKAF